MKGGIGNIMKQAQEMQANMEKVKNHLGSFYEVEGKVIKGKMLCRKLGYPTANINYLDCITPKDGLYAGLVFYKIIKICGKR